MPRKPITRSHQHYYHVVARVNNKENFYVPISQVWTVMIQKLSELQKEFQLKIGSFVLMDNHFHLLVLSPKENIDRIMYFFMKDITRSIQKKSGRVNRIFGGRYKGCIIENERYLLNVYKYIYRNPIAVGITLKAEEYPFSTLYFRKNNLDLRIEIEELLDLNSHLLEWINYSFDTKEADSIKHGLTRTSFQYKKDLITKKIIAPADFYIKS